VDSPRGQADDPQYRGGQSENTARKTSTAPRKTDGPYPTCEQSDPRGQSDKPPPNKNSRLDGLKQSDARTRDEHDE
jgi:hypothetical protein